MVFLLLSILSSTLIMITFRLIERYNIRLFHVIVLNYFSAAALGILLNDLSFSFGSIVASPWFYATMVIGVLLIVMFFFIGFSTQKAGVTVTTVAMRMAVIVPILFSIFFFNETVSIYKIAGIITAIVAVVFSVIKKRTDDFDKRYVFLPLIIFIGAGIIDSLVKYSQQTYLTNEPPALFTAISFAFAAITGIFISIGRRENPKGFFKPTTLLAGILLGAFNFGSIYFFILALNLSPFDSSVVFGINHIGIVTLSALAALTFFNEKLTWLNWLGLLLALTAILLLFNT